MTELVPTDRELQALKVLWQNGEATVREIWASMNQNDAKLAYTTVLSLLQVMEQKKLVGHKRIGKAYSYFPKVMRDRTFRMLAAGFLEKVFDGSVDEYLVHALQSSRISEEELDRLERMVAEAKRRSRQRRRKGKGK